MSKEIINKDIALFKPKLPPDWEKGYQEGLRAGYTKSIVLIRHLQRSLFPHTEGFGEVALENERKILERAIELIAENIEEESEEEKSINQMKRSRE